jgi:hypothetical protein
MIKLAGNLLLAMSIIILFGLVNCAIAGINYPKPFNVSVKPVGTMQKGMPITFYLEYGVNSKWRHLAGDTGSYSAIFINPRDHDDTLSITTFPVRYDSTFSYKGTFQVALPNEDTICCVIRLDCGTLYQRDWNYFISDGDSVKFLENFHMPAPLRYQRKSLEWERVQNDPDPDTLTEIQLEKEYEIILVLGNDSLRRKAESILGRIPISSKSDICPACFTVNTSLGNLIKLADEGYEYEFTTPPPWDRQHNGPVDSVYENKDIDRDTLTYEQLQAELDMAVDLRDKAHMKIAREILGDIPDTCETEWMKGQYIIRMTLEQAYKLHDRGIPLEWARGKRTKRSPY